MTAYYVRTFTGMALVLAVLVAAAVLANSAAGEAKERHRRLLAESATGIERRELQRDRTERLRRAMEPVREFTAAWRNVDRMAERDAAEQIRSEIESIAQRQLGLVTDNAITPQPDRHLFQGLAMRVQRVTLRASGKDLAALMTWVGKVEEKYPAALVEVVEFSSNVGGNTGVTLRLVQPLQTAGAGRGRGRTESPIAPEDIARLGWLKYLPARLKGPVAVGFQRNPLQPAVTAESRSAPLLRDDTDEITPRLEMAIEGRLRSVIRGASPLVVIDGRVFRVGDEILVGAARERPFPAAKTKLKEIGDDRLIFSVSGGSAARSAQCDVTLALPPFLKAR